MSQPEKLAYSPPCPLATWCTVSSNPMYWPLASLNRLGSVNAWYSAV